MKIGDEVKIKGRITGMRESFNEIRYEITIKNAGGLSDDCCWVSEKAIEQKEDKSENQS